jgi:hypothetical protein
LLLNLKIFEETYFLNAFNFKIGPNVIQSSSTIYVHKDIEFHH